MLNFSSFPSALEKLFSYHKMDFQKYLYNSISNTFMLNETFRLLFLQHIVIMNRI